MNSMNLNLLTIFKPLRPLIHVRCKIEMQKKGKICLASSYQASFPDFSLWSKSGIERLSSLVN